MNQGNGELGKVEKLVQEFFQVNIRLPSIPPSNDGQFVFQRLLRFLTFKRHCKILFIQNNVRMEPFISSKTLYCVYSWIMYFLKLRCLILKWTSVVFNPLNLGLFRLIVKIRNKVFVNDLPLVVLQQL